MLEHFNNVAGITAGNARDAAFLVTLETAKEEKLRTLESPAVV